MTSEKVDNVYPHTSMVSPHPFPSLRGHLASSARIKDNASLKSSPKTPHACPLGAALVLKTGRCKKTRAECRAGKIRNPATGRCITTRHCPRGQVRHPRTHRCRRAKHSVKSRTPTPALVKHSVKSRTPTPAFVKQSRTRSRSRSRSYKSAKKSTTLVIEPTPSKHRHGRQKGMMHSGIIQPNQIVAEEIVVVETEPDIVEEIIDIPISKKHESKTTEYEVVSHTPSGYEAVKELDIVGMSPHSARKSKHSPIVKPKPKGAVIPDSTDDSAYGFFHF